MPTLFYHKLADRYLLYIGKDELDLKCHFCKNVFESSEPVVIHKSYTKTYFVKRYYCIECSTKHQKLIADSFVTARMTWTIPDHCKLVSDNLDLSTGNISIISAVELSSVKEVDKTVHAGRESFEGASVGMDVSKLLADKDRDLADIDGFLGEIKDAKRIVPEGKLLESK